MHGRFGASVTGARTTIISSLKNNSNFLSDTVLKDKVRNRKRKQTKQALNFETLYNF